MEHGKLVLFRIFIKEHAPCQVSRESNWFVPKFIKISEKSNYLNNNVKTHYFHYLFALNLGPQSQPESCHLN